METATKIRRRHLVDGESISALAREFHLSRNTVKKYLKQAEPPRYRRSEQPKPKLSEYHQRLEHWLEQDAKRPRRHRRTARGLFEDLQGEGYVGAYDSVQRAVKAWKEARGRSDASQAFVPLVFASGDAGQFDWSHEHVELGGVVQTIKLAHFRLSYSRQPFLVAYPRESQEMVFDAHDRAFAFFGGVPRRMIYDNPKTLVETVYSGKTRRFNKGFLALANHYLFEPVACTPAAGWEKGQVENQVGNIREWLFSPRPRFADFAELNDWLAQQSRRLGERAHPSEAERRIGEVFAEEQAQLRAIERPFAGYTEHPCRVSSTCTVVYDRNRYSVPGDYAGKRVSVRASAERIMVVAEGQQIAAHARHFSRGAMILDPWHYLPVLERKPGALRNGAPFLNWDLPAAIVAVKDTLLARPKGDREFVEVLLAMREHGSEVVEVACELALAHRTISAPVVLNHVHRLLCPPSPPPVSIPEQLHLKCDPLADCERYDQLRAQAPGGEP